MEYFNDNCSDDYCDERSGDLLEEDGPYDEDDKGDSAYHDCLPVECYGIFDEGNYFLACLDGLLAVLVRDACKIFDLTDEEGNCDTCCKACRDRVGNIFKKASESAEAHDYKEDACHDRCDHEAFSAVFHDDACNDGGKSCRRACDLNSASA